MGWNDAIPRKTECLFRGLEEDARFYFLHSYYFVPHQESDVLAITDYNGPYTGVYTYHSNSQDSYSWYGPSRIKFLQNGLGGAWHHLVVVREGTGIGQLKLYRNGVAQETGTVATNLTNAESFMIHRWNDTASTNAVSQFDEVRMGNASHSAQWVLTEYNNQSSPATFYAIAARPSLVTGRVFEDANFTGTASTWDGGTNDLALENVDGELYTSADVYQSSTTTDASGNYTFIAVAAGDYKVRVRSATIGDA